ncbi:hypothetical protein MACK_003278 [Theileria orientalis]|uniref:Uncharacterized protein n=1 Tax=Theileria orientalis TaxID=68886 RepID=A0A976SIF7_THEOR|nr:hypothetical protein MACK_003278 [Theileria orientalis]
MSEQSPGSDNTAYKLIAALVALSSHLIVHQIDVTSANFSIAFYIPHNNIAIYLTKLYSLRFILIVLGTLTEFAISECSKIMDPGDDIRIRRWFSVLSFGGVLLARLGLLGFLYKSTEIAYYFYLVLGTEAYFFGLFHTSFIGIVPEHSLIVALSDDVSRLIVLLLQLMLRLTLHDRPLLMIKLHAILCLIVTIAAFSAWIFYHEFEIISSGYFQRKPPKPPPKTMSFFITFSHAFSPLMMIFVSSLIKDFLFPTVLPYALLSKIRCNLVTVMSSILKLIGPIVLFSLEFNNLFPKWDTPYNAFWLIVIPMVVIFVYTFLAIHTRIPSARSIVNSVTKVMLITVGVVLGNSFFDPLSYAGVSKVVRPEKLTNGNASSETPATTVTDELPSSSGDDYAQDVDKTGEQDGDNAVITIHALLVLFMRFTISKLSAGYNETRISLGYCFPRFRPNHRMSRSNVGWYIFRKTFKSAWKAVGNDFDIDIRSYL